MTTTVLAPNNSPFLPSDTGYRGETAVPVRAVFEALWRRLWVLLLVVCVAIGAAALISIRTPKRWKANAQLILVQKSAPLVLSQNDSGGGSQLVESPETQAALLKSYAMAERTLNYLKNEELAGRNPSGVGKGLTAESLQKDISVESIPETGIFDISVESDDREKSRVLTDAICAAFVQWKREVAQQSAVDVLTTLRNRTEAARKAMIAAEQRETVFKKKHHLVDVTVQQNALLGMLNSRQAEVATLVQEASTGRSRFKILATQLAKTDGALKKTANYRDETLVLALQQQMNQLEIELANAQIQYTDEYPGPNGPTAIRQRVSAVRQKLNQALKATLNGTPSLQGQGELTQDVAKARLDVMTTEAKLNAARLALKTLEQRAVGLPTEAMEYSRLTRSTELARQLYGNLQRSLNAARIDRDSIGGNVQIAQYAFVPVKPLRPDLKRDVLFGAAIGLVLGLLCVLLLEQTDLRIRNIGDFRRLTGGHLLAAVPHLSRSEARDLFQGRMLPMRAVEAFGMARANFDLILHSLETGDGSDGRAKLNVLLVTSAVPGEGKSFTAAQLARSLARAGKNVTLVDADMRRPMQNRMFRTNETVGLANVLEGRISLEDALVTVGEEGEQLTLLHSGIPTRSPSELVSLPLMKKTLDALRRDSDIVIVDTPACASVGDALFLAPYVDAILQVIGAGHTNADIVRSTSNALMAARPRVLTYILNRAKGESARAQRYYSTFVLPEPGNPTTTPPPALLPSNESSAAQTPDTVAESSDVQIALRETAEEEQA